MTDQTTPTTAEDGHLVYPEGPPCTSSCPGAWSTYHDGYSWGYESGEQAARAEALKEWREALRWALDWIEDAILEEGYPRPPEVDQARALLATPEAKP